MQYNLTKPDKTCGQLLATGYDLSDLMDYCSHYHYTNENTVLVVRDFEDTYWELYERIS